MKTIDELNKELFELYDARDNETNQEMIDFIIRPEIDAVLQLLVELESE